MVECTHLLAALKKAHTRSRVVVLAQRLCDFREGADVVRVRPGADSGCLRKRNDGAFVFDAARIRFSACSKHESRSKKRMIE
jgi:hypothetical protein